MKFRECQISLAPAQPKLRALERSFSFGERGEGDVTGGDSGKREKK